MKRFQLLTVIALTVLSSCGVSKLIAPSSIQNTFFGCSFGDNKELVYKKCDYRSSDISISYFRSPNRSVLGDIGNLKIKSTLGFQADFAGYKWDDSGFLFDYQDRLFCVSFIHTLKNEDIIIERYNDLKMMLQDKYGPGKSPYEYECRWDKGACSIILSVMKSQSSSACVLSYIDNVLYEKDTAKTIQDL